jgi:hypothetical protein
MPQTLDWRNDRRLNIHTRQISGGVEAVVLTELHRVFEGFELNPH